MKLTSLSIIFTLFSQLAFASSGVATPPAAPQASSCIQSTFRSTGDQYWRTVTLFFNIFFADSIASMIWVCKYRFKRIYYV